MLNSKYAPIVALTVVVAIILGAIGYFAFVSPAANDASTYRSDKSKIDRNIKTIKDETSQLLQFQEDFDALPDIDSEIVKHMPSTIDPVLLERRIADAVTASNVEIVTYEQSGARGFSPWEADAASLPSAKIAKLFATKELRPASIGSGSASKDDPAVVGPAEISYNGAALMPLEISVAGSVAEIDAFLRALNPTDSPLLLVYAMSLEARQPGSTATGIRDALPGDAIVTLSVAQYLYELQRTENRDRVPDSGIPAGGNVGPS